jgi:hypothetical protein
MASQLLSNEDLIARLHGELAQLSELRMPVSDLRESIAAKVAQLGVTSYNGTVALVGQDSAGAFQVTYALANGGTFFSRWPQWAYEHAKLAKLHGKELWVIANGQPLGPNLLVVTIF